MLLIPLEPVEAMLPVTGEYRWLLGNPCDRRGRKCTHSLTIAVTVDTLVSRVADLDTAAVVLTEPVRFTVVDWWSIGL